MKVYVQVIDTKTGVYQTGMIDEPVMKGLEIQNALKHFGVIYNEVSWKNDSFNTGSTLQYGHIDGTSKIIIAIIL